MNPSSRTTFLLACAMLLAGGAALFACAFLPPLLELRALRVEYQETRLRVEGLEQRLVRVVKHIEHSRNDPAYWERLMRKEFGTVTPGVQEVPVQVQPAPAETAPPDEVLRDIQAQQELEQAIWSHPFYAVFVLDHTRPLVMAMAGVIVLTSLFIMVRSAAPRTPEAQ